MSLGNNTKHAVFMDYTFKKKVLMWFIKLLVTLYLQPLALAAPGSGLISLGPELVLIGDGKLCSVPPGTVCALV